jgi:hypothetical protein
VIDTVSKSLPLVLAVALGCGGSSKPSTNGTTPPSGGDTDSGSVTGTPGKTTLSGPGDPFAYLDMFPADFELALWFNVAGFRETVVWTRTSTEITAALSKEFELTKIKESCGLNPLESIDWIMMGLREEGKDAGLVVIKGLTREQAACIAGTKGSTTTFDGPYMNVTKSGGDKSQAAWLGADIFVIPARERDQPLLPNAIERRGGFSDKEAALVARRAIDTKGLVWFVGAPVDTKDFGGLIQAHGSAHLRGRLEARADLSFGTEEEARELSRQVEQMKNMLKGSPQESLLEGLNFTVEGPRLTVKLNMSEKGVNETLELLLKAF